MPRKIPFPVDNAVPSSSPPSYCNLPDVHAILARAEHTVSPGSKISTGYFPPVLIKSPSVSRSIMDYTERTIPFCTSQMGLTAEEPLHLQASETDHVAAFDAATGPSNSHIHPSTSRWMGPPIPPIGLLNVADPGAICHPSYTQACSLRRTFHHYKTST